MWNEIYQHLLTGDEKSLARAISLVENEWEGYETFLKKLPSNNTKIIGITGAPGAGKSTLVDALIAKMVAAGEKVAVICVDPSSPFNLGAVLGDRIRMSEWYHHPSVFIRSLATRGSLGGLHPKIFEIAELMKAAGYTQIIIETVGVGQSEVEIAGLADTTIVVLVPEAGDDIQTMKAGLMEIADVFVVNKADRPGADTFVNNLKQMLAPAFQRKQATIPILKTIASNKDGIDYLYQIIQELQQTSSKQLNRRAWLMAQKAYHLIQQKKMEGILKEDLQKAWENKQEPNLYRFIEPYLS